jgi:prefoldin subunit 5
MRGEFTLSERRLPADKNAVEAAEQVWRPLGELLLSKNLIARKELDEALAEQEETGKLLGAILVDRGFISGPALAIALAEQYGVELDQQQGFGTGLWAEIERRHRSERGIEDPKPRAEATIVKLEPPQPSLEAVPDPDPDPELERLQAENRGLQDEIERLHTEFTKLRIVEPEPDPQLEQLESENSRLQDAIAGLHAEVAQLLAAQLEPDPELQQLGEENGRLQDEVEVLRAEVAQLSAKEPEPDPELVRLGGENRRLQDEIERLQAEFTKLRDLAEPEPESEPEPELPKSHVLFVPTPSRYLLLERQGPPPATGVEVSLTEGSFVVGKIGRAPVPGDRRACAFLLARA